MLRDLLLFCLILFPCGSVKAQPYESVFGTYGTEWCVNSGKGDVLGPGGVTKYIYEKDTVINSTTYKKVNSDYWDGPFYFREDLIAGKVWIHTVQMMGADSLFMDYNLTVGDTFKYVDQPTDYIVDSVYSLGGRKHIRFQNDNNYENERMEFIEGIGCTAGIWYRLAQKYAEFFMNCVYHDGVCIYGTKNVQYNKCHPFTMSVSALSGKDISLSPNPTYDKLEISYKPLSKPVAYSIINALGMQVGNGTLILNTSGRTIDVSSLPQGSYLLQIEADRIPCTKRFVKF